MNPWNFLAGGAALGLIAGLWDKIKTFAWRLVNLFIQQVEIPTEAAHEALIAYLGRELRPGDVCLVLSAGDMSSLPREMLVPPAGSVAP